MPKPETVLQVFVASPSDVMPERNALEDIIDEFNITWSKLFSIRLDLIRWEKYAYPDLGEDPQDVVNRQVVKDFDIFIGIMWGTFGTATKRAMSGTAEEFDIAYERYKTDPRSISIMMYFKDSPLPPSKLDHLQLQKIQAFKDRFKELGGLYWKFENIDSFRKLLSRHLNKVVQEWASRISKTDDTQKNEISKQVEAIIETDDRRQQYKIPKRSFFEDSRLMNLHVKNLLAKYVVKQYLCEGSSVILDAGTTCYEVAAEISRRVFNATETGHLSIMTHNYAAFSLLIDSLPSLGVEIYLTGGRYDRQFNAVFGDAAGQSYINFYPKTIILGASGIASHVGVFCHGHSEEVQLKNILFSKSTHMRILIIDSSKIGKMDSFCVCKTVDLNNNTDKFMLVTNKPYKNEIHIRKKYREELEKLRQLYKIEVVEIEV